MSQRISFSRNSDLSSVELNLLADLSRLIVTAAIRCRRPRCNVAARAPWAICRARGAAASPAGPSNPSPLNQVEQVEQVEQVKPPRALTDYALYIA